MANLTTKQRDKLPDSDFAGPNRTFPITDQDDVDSAAHLIGKASDPAAVKAAIIRIAKRKGLKVPDAWQTAKEATLTEVCPFDGLMAEEAEGQPPIVRNVTLIRAGTSKNRRHYSEAVLQRDCKEVFEGAPAYVTNHNEQDKTLRNLAGDFRNVRYEAGAVKADLHGLATDPGLILKAMEAHSRFGADRVGLSICAAGEFTSKQENGRTVQEVCRLKRDHLTSVDIVTNPAAGGRLAECLMEENDVKDVISTLTEATLAPIPVAVVRKMVESLTDDDIREANAPLADRIIAKRDGEDPKPAADPAPPVVQTKATETFDAEALRRQILTETQQTIALARSEAMVEALVSESRLPEKVMAGIKASFAGRVVERAEVEKEIRSWRDTIAVPNRPNVAGQASDVQVTEAYDTLVKRLEATVLAEGRPGLRMGRDFDGKPAEPFRRITEMILAFHPERAASWARSRDLAAQESVPLFAWDGQTNQRQFLTESQMATETLSTATLGTAWADVMFRSLRKVVADPDLMNWREIVSTFIPFSDLTNTHKIIRVGEFGNAPIVAEGTAYQPIAAPTNDQEKVGISKYGYLYDITWEAILRDDIGVLARIPANMQRSFNWTVADGVYGTIQDPSGLGPTMNADSTRLYDASHNNIHSSAFSAANLMTARLDLPKQTDPDSGKRKRYRARYLLYQTPDLDQAIWESLNSEYKIPPTITNAGEVNLPNWIKSVLNLTPIPVTYPTATTTRWELVADPADAETLAVGFLGGRDTPEVFIQDMETVGSRFTADKVTYKLRFTFGCSVIDWRAYSRGNA